MSEAANSSGCECSEGKTCERCDMIRESQLLQLYEAQALWSELKSNVAELYSSTFARNNSNLLSLTTANRTKEICETLCKRDVQQLYLRLENQIKSFVIELKNNIVDTGNFEELDDVLISNLFIETVILNYNTLCSAARQLTPFISKLHEAYLKKFDLSWVVLNQYIFYEIYFNEPSIRCKLSKAQFFLDCMEGVYATEVKNRQTEFMDHMSTVYAKWKEIESSFKKHDDELNILKLKRSLLTEEWQVFRPQRKRKQPPLECAPGLAYFSSILTKEPERQINNTKVQVPCDACKIKPVKHCPVHGHRVPPQAPVKQVSSTSFLIKAPGEIYQRVKSTFTSSSPVLPVRIINSSSPVLPTPLPQSVLTTTVINKTQPSIETQIVANSKSISRPNSSELCKSEKPNVIEPTNKKCGSNMYNRSPLLQRLHSIVASDIRPYTPKPLRSQSHTQNIPSREQNIPLKQTCKTEDQQSTLPEKQKNGTIPIKPGSCTHQEITAGMQKLHIKESPTCQHNPNTEYSTDVCCSSARNTTRERLRERLRESKKSSGHSANSSITPTRSDDSVIKDDTRDVDALVAFVNGEQTETTTKLEAKQNDRKQRKKQKKQSQKQKKVEKTRNEDCINSLLQKSDVTLTMVPSKASLENSNAVSANEQSGSLRGNPVSYNPKGQPISTNETSDSGSRMVTIRRIPESNGSEPRVTITLKGETPDKDKILYTLINGQADYGASNFHSVVNEQQENNEILITKKKRNKNRQIDDDDSLVDNMNSLTMQDVPKNQPNSKKAEKKKLKSLNTVVSISQKEPVKLTKKVDVEKSTENRSKVERKKEKNINVNFIKNDSGPGSANNVQTRQSNSDESNSMMTVVGRKGKKKSDNKNVQDDDNNKKLDKNANKNVKPLPTKTTSVGNRSAILTSQSSCLQSKSDSKVNINVLNTKQRNRNSNTNVQKPVENLSRPLKQNNATGKNKSAEILKRPIPDDKRRLSDIKINPTNLKLPPGITITKVPAPKQNLKKIVPPLHSQRKPEYAERSHVRATLADTSKQSFAETVKSNLVTPEVTIERSASNRPNNNVYYSHSPFEYGMPAGAGIDLMSRLNYEIEGQEPVNRQPPIGTLPARFFTQQACMTQGDDGMVTIRNPTLQRNLSLSERAVGRPVLGFNHNQSVNVYPQSGHSVYPHSNSPINEPVHSRSSGNQYAVGGNQDSDTWLRTDWWPNPTSTPFGYQP